MVEREIIEIDEGKCDGCGLCVPNCQEGALQIIDGKARLISDLFCDGLGACIGHCPQGAITMIKREAEEYDERKVIESIIPKGEATIKAHLDHLLDHKQKDLYDQAVKVLKEKDIEIPTEKGDKMDTPHVCPGAAIREVEHTEENKKSELKQWPVQLNLLPAQAPFFNNSHLLVAADCVGFANPDFHSTLLAGKTLVVGCPKLDDLQGYQEKFTEIFKLNRIKSVTVAIMEVPCCAGMYQAVKEAVDASGKEIPVIKEVISVSGEIL